MKNAAEIAHGPMIIGLYINIILLGIIATQMYMYLNAYRKDRLWMKIFVVVLFVANVANTAFLCKFLYTSLILNFGDDAYLARADWVFATDPALTGIIAGMVQLFFAWRVKVLTNNLWLVAIVAVCALAGTGSAIATSFEVGNTPEFVKFQDFKVVVIIWLAAECVSDILISGILVWQLRKTGFQSTDELVDRIIRLTVQTGLITSICAIIDLALFLSDPTGTHLIFNFPLSKLYTNTMMSTLNSRRGWDFSDQESTSHTHTTSGIVGERGKKKRIFRLDTSQTARPQVFVDVEQHVEQHEMHTRNLTDRHHHANDDYDVKSALPDDSLTAAALPRAPWEK
ncbi:uncharacterized protein ARMOST_06019 [Armillaria ostoyae]|uniref:DUF6534 domain-containing protein n=1 Tax=Armillaria ostoyae TaxID=47428 RepID=A0A284R1V7_ARMOS|nr:uncharacterized protein ARMOST_06019 [Armillaria ostoyae]